MKQIIRIIGGKYRGKKLHFPQSDGLRPTPDRVRETLFNWLMNDIQNSRCLDAFAGSGALGFEAFSRGADKVTFIERSRLVYGQLQKNASFFNSPDLIVHHDDAPDFLKRTKEPFDIIFLDPPFAQSKLHDCVQTLEKSSVLRKSGLLYIESPCEIEMNPEYWHLNKLKRAGQVVYALYEKKSTDNRV